MKKDRPMSRCLLVLLAVGVFAATACSDVENLQIEIEQKTAMHDKQKRKVEDRLKAIEEGRPYEDPDVEGGEGGGLLVGSCVCTYRRGDSPPTSCSDSRCGGVRY